MTEPCEAIPMSPSRADLVLDALPADEPALAEVVLEAVPLPCEPPGRRETNPVVLSLWWVGRRLRDAGWLLEWLFGVAVLMVGLAALAALPVLQFLSLGYLLE